MVDLVLYSTAVSGNDVTLRPANLYEWTPLNLSVKPRYIFDPSTFAYSGNNFSSGNNTGTVGGSWSAEAGTAAKTILNGIEAINFTGSQGFLNTTAAWPGGNAYVFAVVDVGTTHTGGLAAHSWGVADSRDATHGWVFYPRAGSGLGGGPNEGWFFQGTGAAVVTRGDLLTDANYHIVTAKIGTATDLRKDGTAGAPTTVTGAITSSLTNNFRIGSTGPSASEPLTGLVAYVAVLQNPTADDIQKLEGWAAWRFGLVANLPATHPYKMAPPTIQSAVGLANAAPTLGAPALSAIGGGLSASDVGAAVPVLGAPALALNGGLWTYANLDTNARYIFDPTTFTYAGSNFSSGANQGSVGGSWTAESGTAAKGTQLNGYDVINFTGSQGLLNNTAAWPAGSNVFVFTVAKVSTTHTGGLASHSWALADGRDPTHSWAFYPRGGNAFGGSANEAWLFHNNNASVITRGDLFTDANYHIDTIKMGSSVGLRKDGTAGSPSSVTGSPTLTASNNFRIGSTGPSAAEPLTALVAFVAVLVDPTLDEIQKLEGWAAWKYGLVSQLDAAHPYKTSAPIVGGTVASNLINAVPVIGGVVTRDYSAIGGVVFEGDSIPFGYLAAHGYPFYFNADSGKPYDNVATGGSYLETMDIFYTTRVQPFYNAVNRNNVHISAGTNDLANSKTDVATEAHLVSWAGKARADGFRVGVSTIIARNDSLFQVAGVETYRLNYNTYVRANWASFADFLVDFDAIPETQDPTNTTYFNTDQVHPTTVLQLLMTDKLELAIAAVGTTSPSLKVVHNLSASALTNVLPVLGPATITQKHILVGSALTNVLPVLGPASAWSMVASALTNVLPILGPATIAQKQVLSSAGLTNVLPVLGPGSEWSPVAAELANVLPVLGPATIAQKQVLSAAGLTNVLPVLGPASAWSPVAAPLLNDIPVLGPAVLAQKQILSAANLSNILPGLGSVSEWSPVAAPLLNDIPVIGSSTITQKHALVSAGLTNILPVLGPASVWSPVAAGLTNVLPVLGPATIAQKQVLAAASLTNVLPVLGPANLISAVASGLANIAPTFGAPNLISTVAAGLTNDVPLLGTPNLISAVASALTSIQPILGPATIIQKQVLVAAELLAAVPTLGDPDLSQAAYLTASELLDDVPIIGSTSFNQSQTLAASGLQNAVPDFGSVSIKQKQVLSAVNLANAVPDLDAPRIVLNLVAAALVPDVPVIGPATIKQKQILAAASLSSDIPDLGSEVLKQVHPFTAVALTAAVPTLPAPAFNQSQTLVAPALTNDVAILGAPLVHQTHVLAPAGLSIPTLIPAGNFSENTLGSLLANSLENIFPSLGAPVIGQKYVLSAASLVSDIPVIPGIDLHRVVNLVGSSLTNITPNIGSPVIKQVQVLSQAGLENDIPLLVGATLSQKHVLSASALTAAVPALGPAIVAQRHVMTAAGLSSVAPVLPGTILGRVVNLTTSGLIPDLPGLGFPALTQRIGLVATALTNAIPALAEPDLVVGTPAASLINATPSLGAPIIQQQQVIAAANLTVPQTVPPAVFNWRQNIDAIQFFPAAPTLGRPEFRQRFLSSEIAVLSGSGADPQRRKIVGKSIRSTITGRNQTRAMIVGKQNEIDIVGKDIEHRRI